MKSATTHLASGNYARLQLLSEGLQSVARLGMGRFGMRSRPASAHPSTGMRSPIQIRQNGGHFVVLRPQTTPPEDIPLLCRWLPFGSNGHGCVDGLFAGCAYRIEITVHDVHVPALPRDVDGLRVLQLSDLHVGHSVRRADVLRMVEQASALQPDLVLLTGDFAHRPVSSTDLKEALAPLGDIPARLGRYASPGNHDHWDGVDLVRDALDAAGIPVLCNENRQLLSGLWLAALDDMLAGQPDLARTLRGIPGDGAVLLMSHNPNVLSYVADRPVIALAGHTHGGQFRLSPQGIPPNGWYSRLAVAFEAIEGLVHAGNRDGIGAWRYLSGWFREGKAGMYVNRGLGVARPPLRYNCPAEIALLRLRSGLLVN